MCKWNSRENKITIFVEHADDCFYKVKILFDLLFAESYKTL